MDKKKIAVFFPGIGYTCDKPLLYYAQKLSLKAGCEIKTVPYGNFKSGIKGDPDKMMEAFLNALSQADTILSVINWKEYAGSNPVNHLRGMYRSACFLRKSSGNW